MIKHIVMWRLKEEAEGRSQSDNAHLIKQQLEALQGQLDGLIEIEVGIDISRGNDSSHIVLYSEFSDKQALASYLIHPLHEAIKPLVLAARSERRVVDYQV